MKYYVTKVSQYCEIFNRRHVLNWEITQPQDRLKLVALWKPQLLSFLRQKYAILHLPIERTISPSIRKIHAKSRTEVSNFKQLKKKKMLTRTKTSSITELYFEFLKVHCTHCNCNFFIFRERPTCKNIRFLTHKLFLCILKIWKWNEFPFMHKDIEMVGIICISRT